MLATLALGIGASTAIFTVINAALLQPLPYHRPFPVPPHVTLLRRLTDTRRR